MFEWFVDLPASLKYGVALLILGISAGAWFYGLFWPWGWGIGFVLLLVAMFLGDDS